MKAAILMVTLLTVSNAFAVSSNDSWETISAKRNLKIEWPSARMTNGAWTGVDFLCRDGEVLRTKKLIETCTKYKNTQGQNSGIVCVNTTKSFGIVKLEQPSTRCVKYSHSKEQSDVCLKYEDYTYVQPTTFEVDVLKVKNVKNDLYTHAFTKEYTIADCQ